MRFTSLYLLFTILSVIIVLRGLTMKSCVIEFEAFRGDDGEYVVKELAITNVEHGISRVGLFKPPFERTRLTSKYTRVADWLKNYYHGLSWNEGEVDQKHLRTIIHDVCITYSTVLTKELEKTRFLNACHNNVRNLNDINAPKYDHTFKSGLSLECIVKNHSYVLSNRYLYNCALLKAEHCANWLRNNQIPQDQLDNLRSL